MSKKDDNIRNISNIVVSKECHKKLRMMSIDREVTVQEVCADILERAMSKKTSGITTEQQ